MPDLGVVIRTMQSGDLAAGLRLSTEGGWNQTERDWQRLYRLAGDGGFVAEVGGEVIGTALAVRFGDVAWVAMVLVEESLRGRGIGTALVRQAIAFCDAAGVATVRLDATSLGRPVYERLGFRPEYELIRYAGIAPGRPEEVTSPLGEDVDDVLRLDRQVTGCDRSDFLRALTAESPGAFFRERTAGELNGYAAVRAGRVADQIGPCLALDSGAGLSLLERAASGRERPVYIDVPVANVPATDWARERGLAEQRRLLRMYRGQPPEERTECLWASSGPEKG